MTAVSELYHHIALLALHAPACPQAVDQLDGNPLEIDSVLPSLEAQPPRHQRNYGPITTTQLCRRLSGHGPIHWHLGFEVHTLVANRRIELTSWHIRVEEGNPALAASMVSTFRRQVHVFQRKLATCGVCRRCALAIRLAPTPFCAHDLLTYAFSPVHVLPALPLPHPLLLAIANFLYVNSIRLDAVGCHQIVSALWTAHSAGMTMPLSLVDSPTRIRLCYRRPSSFALAAYLTEQHQFRKFVPPRRCTARAAQAFVQEMRQVLWRLHHGVAAVLLPYEARTRHVPTGGHFQQTLLQLLARANIRPHAQRDLVLNTHGRNIPWEDAHTIPAGASVTMYLLPADPA